MEILFFFSQQNLLAVNHFFHTLELSNVPHLIMSKHGKNNHEEEKKCVRAIFEGLNSKEGKIFRVFNKSCTGKKRSVL